MASTKTSDDYYNEIKHAATVAAPLFTLYGWTYHDGAPGLDGIVDTIKHLVDEVLDSSRRTEFGNTTSCASGRFQVEYVEYEYDAPELMIRLELEGAYGE